MKRRALLTDFLLDLFFDYEDVLPKRGKMFLRNVGGLSTCYIVPLFIGIRRNTTT
jgi:hypothetical protein